MESRSGDASDRRTTIVVACATVLAGQAVVGGLILGTQPDAGTPLSAAPVGQSAVPRAPLSPFQAAWLPPLPDATTDVSTMVQRVAATQAADRLASSGGRPWGAQVGSPGSTSGGGSRAAAPGATVAGSAGSSTRTVALTVTQPPRTTPTPARSTDTSAPGAPSATIPSTGAPSTGAPPVPPSEQTDDETRSDEQSCPSGLVPLVPRTNPLRCIVPEETTATTGTPVTATSEMQAQEEVTEDEGGS